MDESEALLDERPSRFRRAFYAAAFGFLLYLVVGLAAGAVLGALAAMGLAPGPATMQLLVVLGSVVGGSYGAYSGWTRAPAPRRRKNR